MDSEFDRGIFSQGLRHIPARGARAPATGARAQVWAQWRFDDVDTRRQFGAAPEDEEYLRALNEAAAERAAMKPAPRKPAGWAWRG